MSQAMNELREAAERLRDIIDTRIMRSQSAKWCADERALWLLARAYLAEHQADDDDAIDADWLRSVGRELLNGYCFDGQGITLWLAIDKRNRWMAELMQDDVLIALGEIKTRGDLRLLCRALGSIDPKGA
jgi:hypothetical protein